MLNNFPTPILWTFLQQTLDKLSFFWTHFSTEMLMKVGKCFDRTPREFSTKKKKNPKHLRKMPTLDYQ